MAPQDEANWDIARLMRPRSLCSVRGMASAPISSRVLVVVAIALSATACSSGYFVNSTYQTPPPAPVAAPAPQDGTYTIQRGDTIYVVARKFGLTVRALIDANQLQAPFQLEPGQVLRMPAGGDYVVVKGDSLTKVARKTGTEFATLARINGLKPPYVLHVGQRLTMPAGVNVQTAAAGGDVIESPAVSGSGGAQPGMPAPTPSQPARIEATPLAAPAPRPVATALAPPPRPEPPASASPSAPLDSTARPAADDNASSQPAMRDRAASPSPPATVAAAPAPAPPSAAPIQPVEPVVAVAPPPPASSRPSDAPDFIWPVHGPVLVPFGTIAKGQRNIGVPKGTPVLAAGDGEIAYAGNELSGFGNMLLIKHTGTDYVTVYAHNQKLLVKRGDHVRRGQKIALSGDTGGVSQPQLLFELRKGVRPIDPQTVLPNELSPAVVPAAQQDPG